MEKLSVTNKTRRLAETAIMIALSVVLSAIPVIKLPYGGSVTLFSQLPLVVISYRYGVKWGVFSGFVMGVIQMLLGLENFSWVSGIVAYLILIFADYIVAFGALGLGGIFRKSVKNQAISLAVGGAVVSIIRFVCHYISGVTIWKSYAEDMPAALYSLIYNGSYMSLELLFTVVGAVIVGTLFDFTSAEIKVKKKIKK